jgi:hypothetical protein
MMKAKEDIKSAGKKTKVRDGNEILLLNSFR